MCGVAGLFNVLPGEPPSIEELGRMVGALRHRGPDGAGVYRDAHVGLGHARLAIVDLAGGRQPLASPSGRTWVAYNGEIYNHVELRAELEAEGFVFRTRCDTEVLAAAWEAWGEASLDRFEGQFAFALWEARRRRLVLARDRFGVRPLHWARAGRRLAFASEVKALFQLPEIGRALDPAGLDQVFTFWTPLAPRTAFAGVREIRPGHVATIEPGGELRERPWWTPSFPAHASRPCGPTPIEPSLEALEPALGRATALRLACADVPVGCYLSGGLDSSVIAALARRTSTGPLHTFSLRFEDRALDEGFYQRAMVERLETQHHELVVSRADVARSFEEVIAHVERPVLRAGPAPLFLLSRAVRDAGVKVVLTGEGADEILAGYDLFREAKVRAFMARHPESRLRPRLLERLYPWMDRGPRQGREMAQRFFSRNLDPDAPAFSHLPRFGSAAALKRLFSPALREATQGRDALGELLADLPEAYEGWGPLSRAQYLEMRTLLEGYLLPAQGDRPGLAHGVEGRFPFLDSGVVACAAGLPEAHKLHVLEEKYVLKRLAARLVPRVILERPKQPYRAPDAVAFLGAEEPAYVAELLGEPALREAGLFDPEGVRRLLAKCRGGAAEGALGNADNMAFVGVLSTQILWNELCRRPPARVVPPALHVIDEAG